MDFIGFVLSLLVKFLVLLKLKEKKDEKGVEMIEWILSRLICRYALDVNVQRPEDVLMHKRLLHLAFDPVHRPAIEVRLVQVRWFD